MCGASLLERLSASASLNTNAPTNVACFNVEMLAAVQDEQHNVLDLSFNGARM